MNSSFPRDPRMEPTSRHQQLLEEAREERLARSVHRPRSLRNSTGTLLVRAGTLLLRIGIALEESSPGAGTHPLAGNSP